MKSKFDAEFEKCLSSLTGKYHAWEIWADWVYITAAALSQPLDFQEARENRYKEIVSKYDESEVKTLYQLSVITVKALEDNMEQDFLGNLYMNLGLGDHWKGQFFTPYHLCEAMAMIACENVVEEVRQKGYITMNDCACGGGATMIAGFHQVRKVLEKSQLNAQDHVLIVAQDISEMTALMCYIQLSLLGIAAVVKIGNTLTDPMSSNPLFVQPAPDVWLTPTYNMEIWAGRRMCRILDAVFASQKGANANGE